ncbi:alpha-galactosidase [Nitzschia inconspicua]|uniref:alpha-galactosidase n=1 Tax=Nitzschia inconspicua TaxID=303405 RepID=A0A9K3LKU2_9STRA|nr:alpha-galactosidase [Nitzschia inconspicua]
MTAFSTVTVATVACHALIAVSLFQVQWTVAYDNGVGLTPPMGWNHWNAFHCDGLNEGLIHDTAHAMVDLGLAELGYVYLNIDDCWQLSRNSTGFIQEDLQKFPSGIAALSDYVHNLGHKFGLYSDSGIMTCQRRPGGLGHEQQDAAIYNEWKIDYLKYDNCYATGLGNVRWRYRRMHDALNATGRTIFFSMCEWGVEDPATWAMQVGNSWRTTADIGPTWKSITQRLDLNDQWHAYAGIGGWNDPDMLEVGNGDLTLAEQRAHFTMWCLIKSPLLLGNDLRSVSPEVIEIISNKEVIALNQDPLGVQGYKRWSKHVKQSNNNNNNDNEKSYIRNNDRHEEESDLEDDNDEVIEVWAGDLSGGDIAVVLLNRSSQSQIITATFVDIGFTTFSSVKARDLWAHQDLGIQKDAISATVGSHDVVALRLTPVSEEGLTLY